MDENVTGRGPLEIAYIFDLDGVLSDNSSRQHLLAQTGKTKKEIWKEFYEASGQDSAYDDTVRMLWHLQAAGAKIIICTGRSSAYEDLLLDWLERMCIKPDEIFQRNPLDFRKDWEVKQDYIPEIKKKYLVLGVFEDRLDCVKMWRANGFTCYQPRDASY